MGPDGPVVGLRPAAGGDCNGLVDLSIGVKLKASLPWTETSAAPHGLRVDGSRRGSRYVDIAGAEDRRGTKQICHLVLESGVLHLQSFELSL